MDKRPVAPDPKFNSVLVSKFTEAGLNGERQKTGYSSSLLRDAMESQLGCDNEFLDSFFNAENEYASLKVSVSSCAKSGLRMRLLKIV